MSTRDPQGGSSRVEREILEILERADAAPRPVDHLQAAVRRQKTTARSRLSRATPPAWNPELLRIGGALLLAILAAVVADVSRLIAIVLAVGSAIAFFSLWLPSRGPHLGDAPRWRGQDLRRPGSPPAFDPQRLWPRRNPKGPLK
jgi:hypothetical protein